MLYNLYPKWMFLSREASMVFVIRAPASDLIEIQPGPFNAGLGRRRAA
jgi:hypothetical protein